MISVARPACLLPLLPDLRHHRAMVKDESGGTNPWLRASKWLRISAWLPPGLALGWLAALVTLIHSVGLAVAAWGATVSVVLLLVLLVGQLQRATTQKHSIGNQTPAGVDGSEQPGVASAAASAETAEALPPLATTDAVPGPVHASVASTVTSSSVSGLQVLTVEEVASVLRVDTKSVITSISNGELPGKQIGSHWRVDLGALTRWLQGPYGRT
jgi:excisionase family DNA binding protein